MCKGLINADQAQRCEWDVIIIGTDMGGSVFGWRAAKAGLKTLFIEKGWAHFRDPRALRGKFAEEFFPKIEAPERKHRGILARAGRCWEEVEDLSGRRPRRFVPFIGCGSGGSSALYGMALERFAAEDLTPRKNFLNPGASTVPDEWPITYAELSAYYAEVEKLFAVRGGAGFLTGQAARRDSYPELNPANRELFETWRAMGLQPYRLPLACNFERGSDRCQSFLDAGAAKNDAARICLSPALDEYDAA